MSFIAIILVMESSLNQCSPRYGILHFFVDVSLPPPLVPNPIVSFTSHISLTYFFSQNTVVLESLSNNTSFFKSSLCASLFCVSVMCTPAQPMCCSSLISVVDGSKSFFLFKFSFSILLCANWVLFIAHSSFGILSLIQHCGDLCPALPQQ